MSSDVNDNITGKIDNIGKIKDSQRHLAILNAILADFTSFFALGLYQLNNQN